MKLKALLVCDDVRFEIGGTMTLVGVVNERLVVPAGEGPIVLPRLAVLAVIGELRGVERIGYHQWIRHVDDELADAPFLYERHDLGADDHNFIMVQSPIDFGDGGTYEIGIRLAAGEHATSFTIPLRVERA